jgi:hypothetical protein
MEIDIKNLKDVKLEDLKAESAKISQSLAAARAVLRAINNEITIRENVDLRVKHIENLSDEELARVLEERGTRRAKAQSISGAGDVASSEVVIGTADIEARAK